MARLGDVCTVVSGTTPKSDHPEYWDGKINWVTPAELTDDSNMIFESQRKITQQAVKDSNLKAFPAGTVLLSSRAPIGKVAIAGTEMYCNQGFKNLICSERIYNRYLYHFLRSKTAYLNSLGRGATFKEISKSIVENIEIPLPHLDEQRKIAAVLDKVSDLIAKRRQQLDKLDTLVKARFVEMFGDPVSDTFGWNQAILREVTSKIGSGATPKGGKESYQLEGITLIRSMNVHDGHFEYKDLAHITETQAAQLENVVVKKNDVFINITGASVARSCIVPSEVLPARVNQHVAIIRCMQKQLNPIFANHMFLNDRFKRQLLDIGESGGATRQAITKQQLEMLRVILPPMELQKHFSEIVTKVNIIKFSIQKSCEKLETLKKTLMQQYFG